MSLLNDMLKDLAKNKRTATVGPLLTSPSSFSWLRSLSHISPWVILPFLSGVLFLCLLYLYNVAAVTSTSSATPPTTATLQQPSSTRIQEASNVASIPAAKTIQAVEPVLISALPDIPSHLFTPDAQFAQSATDEETAVNKVFVPLTDTEWHDEQLNLALVAIQDNQDERAEQILHRILMRFPRAIVARETMANLYLAQGRNDSAQQVIEEGLQLLPHVIALNTLKARLLFEDKHPREALSILKQFSPGIQKDPDFYGLMAAILQTLGERQEAEALYKVLVKVEPSNSQYWLGYAIALEQAKNVKQAITAYKTVTEHYDADPDVRVYAENRLKTLQG